MSPARVFEDSKPAGGFRQISEGELAWQTAEHFPGETVEPGGIVTLPDKRCYSHPLLLLIQGEQRECVRLRNEKCMVSVLPARKGEEVILAPLCGRVGNNDAQALADAHRAQGLINRAVGTYLNTRTQCEIIPQSSDAIPVRDFFETAAQSTDSSPVPSLYRSEFEEPSVEEM